MYTSVSMFLLPYFSTRICYFFFDLLKAKKNVVKKILSSLSMANNAEGGVRLAGGLGNHFDVFGYSTVPGVQSHLVDLPLAGTIGAFFIKLIRLVAMGIPRLLRCCR